MPPILIQCGTFRETGWRGLTDVLPGELPVVYRVLIAEFVPTISFLTALLNPGELVRARRYHQPKDQQRFIVARGVLRSLLGRYTDQSPADVGFKPGINKKPVLSGFPGIHYNVSHAGDWVLIAVGATPVGVDVEPISPDFDYNTVLLSSFNLAERRYIDGADSRARFYQLWTRKESLIKATAKGIDDDFSRIPALDGTHPITGELFNATDSWRVGSFTVANGYAAALAYTQAMPEPEPAFYTVSPEFFAAFR